MKKENPSNQQKENNEKSTKRQDLLSYHAFLLPFKWSKKSADVLADTDFLELLDAIQNQTGNKWHSQPFDIKTVLRYNEYQYFYDYVSEILYEKENGDKNTFIKHFEYQGIQGGTYRIELASDKIYNLEIDSVLLHLYNTGVGVLSFHLNNRDPQNASPEDILAINEFGRRVFPPFYNQYPQNIGYPEQDEETDFENLLPVGKLLAESLTIHTPKGEKLAGDDWKTHVYKWKQKGQSFDFPMPGFLEPFIGVLEEANYKIRPILDDRMFVCCWYGNQKLANSLYRKDATAPTIYKTTSKRASYQYVKKVEDTRQPYLSNDWWYKYVHIDPEDKSIQNDAIQADIIQQATNTRWAAYGTFFGITDYSFVILTGDLAHLRQKHINAAFLVTHMQTMYYKMAELALVQRASVQQFSDEVTHISSIENVNEAMAQKAKHLYQRYIRFVNRIYFREVTAQVQGIELYDKLHQQSRLREQVDSLKEEIHELYHYIQQINEAKQIEEDRQRNEHLNTLTMLGSWFLPPSLILAIFSTAVFGELSPGCEVFALKVLLLLLPLSAFFSYKAYQFYLKKKDNTHLNIWFWSALCSFIIIMAFALSFPILLRQNKSCEVPPSKTEQQIPILEQQLNHISSQLDSLVAPANMTIDTLNH